MKRFWFSTLLVLNMVIAITPKLAAQTEPEPISTTNIDQIKLLVDLPMQDGGQDEDVQWASDGRTVAIATKLGGQAFDLSATTSKPTMVIDGYTWTKCMDYTPDRSVVLTCDAYGSTTWLWDRHTGEKLATLNNGTDVLEYGHFSPNGKLLVIINGFEQGLYVWGINGGKDAITPANARLIKLLKVLDFGSYPSDFSFSPDGTTLAAVSGNNMLWLWDLKSLTLKSKQAYDQNIAAVAFSPDGQQLALGMDVKAGDQLRLVNVADGSLIRSFNDNLATDPVNDVNFSPDGTLLVSAHNSGLINLWSVADGKLLHTFDQDKGLAWRAAFNRDGTLLATLNFDDGVRIWGIGDALALIPKPSLTLKAQAVVTLAKPGDVLNMRAEAGTQAAKLDSLKAGVIVTLVDGPTQADDLTWWKIRTANGEEGWVAELVDGEQTLTVDN